METTEQKERKGMFDDMIEKAMSQANLPRCSICKGVIASGAIASIGDDGTTYDVCLKCVHKAIRVYIKKLNGD